MSVTRQIHKAVPPGESQRRLPRRLSASHEDLPLNRGIKGSLIETCKFFFFLRERSKTNDKNIPNSRSGWLERLRKGACLSDVAGGREDAVHFGASIIVSHKLG